MSTADFTAWVQSTVMQLIETESLPQCIEGVTANSVCELVLTLIAGDASPRKYFRATLRPGDRGDQTRPPVKAITAIAVSSPASEKNPEFLAIRTLLAEHGVRVPQLLAANLDHGFLLLEDLGDEVLLPLLSDFSVGAWYGKALAMLADFTGLDVSEGGLEVYDGTKLAAEMGLFMEWFLPQLLGLAPDAAAQQRFAALSACLIDNALAQPLVFVHRDFHSRNLMVLNNRDIAVIDFQDAVIGPITYDAVSLLKDCYIRWPRKRQIAWLLDHYRALRERGVLAAVSEATFIRWFDLMGLQRHLKVLGIFARLCLRDGKPGYLKDLPIVLASTAEALAIYAQSDSAIAEFERWFTDVVMPRCREQRWFASTQTGTSDLLSDTAP